MTNKSYVIVGLVALLLVLSGGYYGFKKYQRYQLLRSDSILLLVNSNDATFTVYDGDYIGATPEEVESDYDIAEVLPTTTIPDNLKMTILQGFTYVDFGFSTIQNTIPSSGIDYPEAGDELTNWELGLATIQDAQKALCNSIENSAYAQYCLFQHITLNASRANDQSLCSSIFVDRYKDECELMAVNEGNTDALADTDSNGIIDIFEQYKQDESIF